MLSCMLFTEPLEVTVVASPQSTDGPTPKRTSFPSMLPSTPIFARAGSYCHSAARATTSPMRKRTIMAAKMAQPWRRLLIILPKVKGSATGMSRMESISRKLDSGVGFSKGWAELALKKPPPLEPSCLIATCDAAGPTAMTCSAPSRVWAFT